MSFYSRCLFYYIILFGGVICSADAFQYNIGHYSFGLTGYGTAGFMKNDTKKPDFIGDWRLRGQMLYRADRQYSFGLVYAIDDVAINEDNFMREAFVFFENRSFFRIEFGMMESVARKLGVGLPDVGALRINDRPLFYDKISQRGPIIGDTVLTTGYKALRANIVSVPFSGVQYGVSVAGITDDYDYTVDFGLKIRRPTGKLKSVYSFASSFTKTPDHYRPDYFSYDVNADWRMQASMGMNLQYNSWIFGLNTRVIYDKDPMGVISDGLSAGAGLSYDILNYSLSMSYILSDTGIWHHNFENYIDNTLVASFRYKYSENVEAWFSTGFSSNKSFLMFGLKTIF